MKFVGYVWNIVSSPWTPVKDIHLYFARYDIIPYELWIFKVSCASKIPVIILNIFIWLAKTFRKSSIANYPVNIYNSELRIAPG